MTTAENKFWQAFRNLKRFPHNGSSRRARRRRHWQCTAWKWCATIQRTQPGHPFNVVLTA